MAVVTRTIAQIEGVAQVRIVFDDAKAVSDGEGFEFAPCDLIRVEWTVLQPVELVIQRGNSQNFFAQTIQPGSGSVNAGGPVKTVGDLARFALRSV